MRPSIEARWKAAIEGLTPSGSEFVDDPEMCALYIRDRWGRMAEREKRLRAVTAQRDALLAACKLANGPLQDAYREAIRHGLSLAAEQAKQALLAAEAAIRAVEAPDERR